MQNNSTADGANIVLRTGGVTAGMKWRIEAGNEGYKIVSYSDSAMVLATYSSNSTPGQKLILGDYVDNQSYRDEWELEPYSVVLYGITNSGHDHISCLNTIYDDITHGKWHDVIVRSGAISALACKHDLLTTNLFTSRSHGVLVTYSGTNDISSTGIQLDDAEEVEDARAFYSHSWSGMSSDSLYILDDEDYSQIDVALFIGCETAAGREGARNLPTAIVSHGARAAVGFSENIICDKANEWTIILYDMLLQGATLKQAVEYACDQFSADTGLKSAVICGDSTIVLT